MSRRPDWPACAAALAERLPKSRLDPDVVAWLDQARRSRGRIGVAVSGGADSTALLLLLWAHWPRYRRRWLVLHFNHRLRGRESNADAAFCREFARGLGVRCEVGRWARPHRSTRPSEAAAREARHAFLRRAARVICFGHQQNDVAESMLMRLARGSGSAGLAAPRPVQSRDPGTLYLRPLLTLSRAELETALGAVGARWRDDASNAQPVYFRNRVRSQVLPAWCAAAQRDAIAGAARSRPLLAEDDAALETWLERLRVFGRSGDLLLARLKHAPVAIWRRALHRWLLTAPRPLDLSRQAFEALLAEARDATLSRHSVGADLFAVRRKGRLCFESGIRRPKFQRRVN